VAVSPDRLERRQLNRALLARQFLLGRVSLPALDVVEHLVGMQSQAPLAHYVGLWSRVTDFDPLVVGSAVADGSLVRTHAMRGTVHLFTRRDALVLRPVMAPMLATRFGSSAFAKHLKGVDLDDVRRVARSVAVDAPLSRVELGRRLAPHFPGFPEEPLAHAAVFHEPMAQPPPRGVWGSRGSPKWQTYKGLLGVDAADATDAADAERVASIDDVVLRYLAAFGPASVADIRSWSGLSGLREVVSRLGNRLRVLVDENGRELFDVPDAPLPAGDVPAPVRFLPEYDNVLLAHADRSRVIPDKRPVPLFAGDGARAGTVLVDGDFRATWRLSVVGGGATITVTATPKLTRRESDDVRAEGLQLLRFLAPEADGDVVTTATD
jgi:hypothetical protein